MSGERNGKKFGKPAYRHKAAPLFKYRRLPAGRSRIIPAGAQQGILQLLLPAGLGMAHHAPQLGLPLPLRQLNGQHGTGCRRSGAKQP